MAARNEWKPWYRRKKYKGNLSEEEKRILDSFRLKDKHPATAYEYLPDEVQGYISALELQLYEEKQNTAAAKCLFWTFAGIFLLSKAYTGQFYNLPPLVGYVFGAAIIVFGWFRYWRESNKNENDMFPKQEGAPNQSDQGIQAEWELNYIVDRARLKRRESEPED